MTDLMKLIKSICEPGSLVPFNPYSGGDFHKLNYSRAAVNECH